jgi:hypothetical protein
MNIPKEVVDLAEQRIQARENKDFALSDQLREKISNLGYVIKDNPGGYELVVKPPFEVFDNLASIKIKPERLNKRIAICLLIDGWLEDTKECINALLKFMPQDAIILALDLGNKELVGNYLAKTEKTNQNLVAIHTSQTLEQAGWANSINKLIELNPAEFSVVMDLSSIISGDAITPLIDKINGEIVAAGWKGSLVKLDDEWRSVEDKGAGEVDILLGYLFAIKTKIAQEIPANSKAKFYRNADLEWSLELRSKGHKLVALGDALPVEQKRHHGYHDSDIDYREKESKKTYDRILQNYRGKNQILSPRR